MPCTTFTTYFDCSYVGVGLGSGNTTNMACRGLDNTLRTNKHDPTGYCLDSTASGSTIRSPLPTP